jgi:hypothetical protein
MPSRNSALFRKFDASCAREIVASAPAWNAISAGVPSRSRM